MSEKNVLVVFYSRTGTTKKLAGQVAAELGADLEEIVDRKSRRGPVGFVVGAKDALMKSMPEIDDPVRDPADYDLIVVGTPVWAGTMAPAVRTWLSRHEAALKKVAYLITAGGSGVQGTVKAMDELAGRTPVATLFAKTKEVRDDRCASVIDRFVAAVREA